MNLRLSHAVRPSLKGVCVAGDGGGGDVAGWVSSVRVCLLACRV